MFKRLAAITIAVTILGATPAYAGQWMQDSAGWWWQNDDGSYPTSEWRWLDGNNDGVSEKYYFGADGYMLSNGAAPDGQLVDGSGAWIENGVVQTETTEWSLKDVDLNLTDEEYAQLEAFLNKDWSKKGSTEAVENADVIEVDADELAYRIIELVNEEREKKGREPLAVNDELMDIAVMRAEESDYCAPHTRPDGSSYATAVPFSDHVGENLMNMTYGYRDLEETAEDAVNGWMNSSGHKRNILNSKWTETGVGVYIEGSKMRVIQLFIY